MRSIVRILLLVVVIFGGYLFYQNFLGHGKKIKINDKSEVFIKQDATEDEGKKLGQFLLESDFFDTVMERSVQLKKENDSYTVRFVINRKEFDKNPKQADNFMFMPGLLAKYVFPKDKVEVILCDDHFKDITTVKGFPRQD